MAVDYILSLLRGTKAPDAAQELPSPVIHNDIEASGALRIRAAGTSFTRARGSEGWADSPPDTVQVPFEFVIVPGARVEEVLETLGKMRPGITPVIWGEPRKAGLAIGYYEVSQAGDSNTILSRAETLDIEHWFATRYDALVAYARARYEQTKSPADAAAVKALSDIGDEDSTPPRGDWPETVTPTLDIGATTRYDAADKKMVWRDEVVIALLPTADPSEVPAHMRFGGWNDCPPPELHVAMARRWAASHGARILVCGSDTIEMRVERPISTREEAIEMALLQYRYCSDIVDQGVGTIEDLAASLIGSKVWYFWWD
jgi:hypothetical protein